LRPRERLVAAGDTQLFLREWGKEGAPILFWHGLGDHTALQMGEAGPILARQFGYRVIGLDAPGFGGSPRLPDERYRMTALVELARELLDSLGLEQAAWAGSSWGAMVGVHFAVEHAERLAALVLIDGGYQDPRNEHGKTLEKLREHWHSQPGFRYDTWEALIEDTRGFASRWSPQLEEYVRSAFREENGEIVSIMGPDVYAAALHAIDRAPPSSVHERLGRTGLPILLLSATEPADQEERRRAALAQFADRVPQAEVRRVEGAPHLMLEEFPEETARAVGNWLRGLGYV
jgi:pimeloyl-ACP methyl ester carboxylesterase